MNNLSEQPTEIDDYDKILRAQEQVSGEIECLRDAEKTKEVRTVLCEQFIVHVIAA